MTEITSNTDAVLPISAARRVLLLTPSSGFGGGIERYAQTLESAFATQGNRCHCFALRRAGPTAHARLLTQSRKILHTDRIPTRIVVLHRALLPVAWLLNHEEYVSGISVLLHGSEVWRRGPHIRTHVENHILRKPCVRVLAMSSFTAGSLAGICPATVLPSGMSKEWFHTLVAAGDARQKQCSGFRIVTAFRLPAWREKGLPELIDAIAALGRSDIHLAVCGTGESPVDLQEMAAKRAWCTLLPGLSDGELAHQLAAADLFVLATRTRTGRQACGEGFGLVLLEAQVAGTPVVGPAYGGSSDAYIDRVTGVAPVDETAGELAKVLDNLLQHPQDLKQMGVNAARWARKCFAPECYAQLAVARFL